MRLERIRRFLTERNMSFTYREEDDCGTIDFIHKGLGYHIWEFPAPERGAESNVRLCGRMEEFEGDYEEAILGILETW